MENQEQRTHSQQPNQQTVIVNQIEKKSNGAGTAGFIFALITIFLGWIPVFGWILWLIGLILSLVGLARQPRGLAIAGLVISLLGLILLLAVFGAIIGAASLL